MIRLPEYDIDPPPDALQTDPVDKPTPESDPITDPVPLEMDRILKPFDRAVLFSGGDDSLVLTHYAMEQNIVDVAIHLKTGTDVPENIDFIRNVAEEYCWGPPIIALASDRLLVQHLECATTC